MMQTLTEFFHSWWWEALILATSSFGSAATVFLYYDLDGMMKKKTLIKIVAVEMLLCSTYGFGDCFNEMIKGAAMPFAFAVICYILFGQLQDDFDNAYF